jgi:hypothetical protein
MYYTFSKPKQEGSIKVVEISEYGKIGCLRRTKIRLEQAEQLLSHVLEGAYKEDLKVE